MKTNEVLENIKARRSVRAYTEPVSYTHLASLFRINTFRGFGDGFISIFSSHVAKIRLYTENTICRLEILNDTFATNIRLMWHKGAVVSL